MAPTLSLKAYLKYGQVNQSVHINATVLYLTVHQNIINRVPEEAAPRASGFYSTPEPGRNEMCIAYVLNTDDLKKAMKVFTEALKVYPGTTII